MPRVRRDLYPQILFVGVTDRTDRGVGAGKWSGSVLICAGDYRETPQTGSLNSVYFSGFWRLVVGDQGVGRAVFR